MALHLIAIIPPGSCWFRHRGWRTLPDRSLNGFRETTFGQPQIETADSTAHNSFDRRRTAGALIVQFSEAVAVLWSIRVRAAGLFG